MSLLPLPPNGPAAQREGDPRWPRPRFNADEVIALMTTRQGGVSAAPWDSLNLGQHVGDVPADVEANRQRVSVALGLPSLFLDQVHGVHVHPASSSDLGGAPPVADAAWTMERGLGLAVQVADCLPVLFALAPADHAVPAVAAAHAGWRGLCAGVIEATVAAVCAGTGARPAALQVWLGPCIGPGRFEVGPEVRDAFVAVQPEAEAAFRPAAARGKWLADLHALARLRLQALGVHRVSAQPDCTVSDASSYFSFRRDGTTGRMAALIGLRA